MVLQRPTSRVCAGTALCVLCEADLFVWLSLKHMLEIDQKAQISNVVQNNAIVEAPIVDPHPCWEHCDQMADLQFQRIAKPRLGEFSFSTAGKAADQHDGIAEGIPEESAKPLLCQWELFERLV